jgi:hypothetical protein
VEPPGGGGTWRCRSLGARRTYVERVLDEGRRRGWPVASVERTVYRGSNGRSQSGSCVTRSPRPVEVGWAEEKTTAEQQKPAPLVLLKSYQRLGYLPDLAEVPAAVVAHVRHQAGLAVGGRRARLGPHRETAPRAGARPPGSDLRTGGGPRDRRGRATRGGAPSSSPKAATRPALPWRSTASSRSPTLSRPATALSGRFPV